jgi:hypothetical protein
MKKKILLKNIFFLKKPVTKNFPMGVFKAFVIFGIAINPWIFL